MPHLDQAEFIQLIWQMNFLKELSDKPRAVNIEFEFGLPDDYDPLLPALINRLLFGKPDEHDIKADIDFSTVL